MSGAVRSGFDWMFRSRVDGRCVVGHFPNTVLLVFIVAAVLRWLWAPDGIAGVVLDVVATVALLVWALDEVVRGVNPFRRMLGVGVALIVLVGLIAR